MLNPIEINFKLDKTIKREHSTELMIKSHDINVIEFHISFDGLELTADHTVKVLSVFNDTKSQTNVTCDIVGGKAIYRPDTSLISQYEHAQNYVYVYHGDQSLDVRLFTYSVDLSQIDKTALKVKTVYDQSYSDLLADFEQALEDYKDSLPQASDLRAEVDVILNKFKTDSVAKLSQYDADAQQVIADNQTAFGVAESGRQDSYEQAESDRNQASNQAVADWEQGADALLETVESNESVRADAETTRKTAETDRVSSEATRKTNETTRISNEDARKSAEVIRLANEVDRVNAEDVRAEFYEGFDGEIATMKTEIAKKANRQQEGWITPTLLNGYVSDSGKEIQFFKDSLGFVHIRGAVREGVFPEPIFVLPYGFRPSRVQSFPTITGLQSNGQADVIANGNTRVRSAGNHTFDGISFLSV